MLIERFNPAGLPTPEGYVHVAAATAGRTVHVAGQVALQQDGELVGAGDLAAQTEQALVNVGAALAGVGATMDDVVQLTLLVAAWDEDALARIMDGVMRAAARVGAPVAAATLIPVSALSTPGALIEIAAQAAIA